MSKKPSFSVDENNNLSIENNNRKLTVRGRFSTDKDNRLIYWLNEPCAWQRKYRLGKVFVFAGQWKLNSNHDLELQLDKSELWQQEDALTLKGNIISFDNDKLVFQISSKDSCGHTQIYLLKLGGYWQADKSNRLNFAVKKTKEPAEILLLSGAWQVNQNQQIVYSYEKTNLKTKTKLIHRLTFNGYWQINSAQRLAYILSSDSKSRFDFRAQIESPNLYPADGVIKYRLGLGVKQSRSSATPRVISLYGTWKFSRKFELYFQMDYGQDKMQKISFGTQIQIDKNNDILVSLTNSRNEALGLRVVFTHRFLKKLDAEAFVRLETRERETAVKAGIRIPF